MNFPSFCLITFHLTRQAIVDSVRAAMEQAQQSPAWIGAQMLGCLA